MAISCAVVRRVRWMVLCPAPGEGVAEKLPASPRKGIDIYHTSTTHFAENSPLRTFLCTIFRESACSSARRCNRTEAQFSKSERLIYKFWTSIYLSAIDSTKIYINN